MTRPSKIQFEIGMAPTVHRQGILRSKLARIAGLTSLTLTIMLAFPSMTRAQDSLPFAVSNPKHQKWAMFYTTLADAFVPHPGLTEAALRWALDHQGVALSDSAVRDICTPLSC